MSIDMSQFYEVFFDVVDVIASQEQVDDLLDSLGF